MKKRIIAACIAACAMAGSAQAALLSDLILGGSITAGDKLFDNWEGRWCTINQYLYNRCLASGFRHDLPLSLARFMQQAQFAQPGPIAACPGR